LSFWREKEALYDVVEQDEEEVQDLEKKLNFSF